MDVFLKKYFWVFYLLVIAMCSLLLGKAVAVVLGASLFGTDVSPVKLPTVGPIAEATPKRDITPILSRNIFCFNCDPIVVAPPQPNAPPVPTITDTNPQRTSLQLQLVALMPSDDADWSMAVIRDLGDERKPVNLYRRTDAIRNGQAQIAQITEQKVYLLVGSKIEYLDYTTPPTVPSPPTTPLAFNDPNAAEMSALDREIDRGVRCSSPTNCEIDRSVLDKVLGNTTALATSARIIPAMGHDGKPGGFKIYPMRPNSILGKIGIQSGDTIRSINGLDMSSPDKALEVYAKLRTASHLNMVVERRGETVSLDYTIR